LIAHALSFGFAQGAMSAVQRTATIGRCDALVARRAKRPIAAPCWQNARAVPHRRGW
jgi:hypothetical protein